MNSKFRPLRLTLASSITALVVVVSLSILTMSYFSGTRSLLVLSENMTAETSKGIIEKIGNLLSSAEKANVVINLLISRGTLDLNDGQRVMDLAAVILSNNDGFSSVEIALANGSKYMAAKDSDGSIMRRADVRTNTNVTQSFFYENANSASRLENNVKSLEQGYDSRTRPWFIMAVKAGKLVWTDMYVSGFAKQFVYSCVMPIYDKNHKLLAVAAIDIQLISLSKFLGALRIFEHGKAFITNAKDQAIAVPINSEKELDQLFKRSPAGSKEPYQLYDAEELPQQDIRMALLTNRRDGKKFFEFESAGGESTLASLVEFPYGSTKFKIGIVAPKSDIMGDISRNTRYMFLGVLLFLIFAVLIVFRISQRISGSLAVLCEEVDKASKLQLDSNVVVDTNILEVSRIDEAVTNMKHGLRSFKKYVPADLVLQLNTLKKEAVLGGERKNLSLFFSDIADFTTISERLTPEELVEQLGVYFNGMSRIVLDNAGTLDKYIGDSIMAFWGAPLQQENHAYLACVTALKCQRYLDGLEIESKATSHAVFHTRIGIHTAEVIVGNIGYEERMNYTVIGDGVNLASRLESLNKYYRTKIMISEDTFNLVSNDFVARRLDMVAVKGKTRGVLIYELVAARGDIGNAQETFLQAYERGMEFYLNRSWAAAKRAFAEAQALAPLRTDYPSELLVARCEEFMRDQPGADWTGVYSHKSK